MHQSLHEAFKIIHNREPDPSLQEWEVARDVMEHFDGRIIPEDLAKECVFQVVNHTIFPDQAMTREVVERAENLAEELFSELSGVDANNDTIAHLERKYYEKKESIKLPENKLK